MRQALAAARHSTEDPDLQRQVVDEVGQMLAAIDLVKTPPENAVFLYRLIADITGKVDPFAELKQQSNSFALSIRDGVQDKIKRSKDPLRTALGFAACGNVIDYAAQHSFDPVQAMEQCEHKEFLLDAYDVFWEKLEQCRPAKVLYLADNCGEIVFDGLLIAELQQMGAEVVLAVRGGPIINDATMEDVHSCGLDALCRVIDNGTSCPGTPLPACSVSFQETFADADIILSKGMGNFETLSDVAAPIFFLFTVKCNRVAQHVRKLTGKNEQEISGNVEMIFLQQKQL